MGAREGGLVSPDIAGQLDRRGEVVEKVPVQIDYAIIEHFSKHLYGSPNKAVEELVSNGFDALASSVYVYLPGAFTNDHVLVWDDGESMSVQDLHRLWWIARSPKDDSAQRIAVSEDGKRKRPMIGKFGIGKLASYVVGHRLTHLCRRGNEFLRVSVDYRRVPQLQDLKEGEQSPTPQTSIVKLSEEEARDYVLSLFNEAPASVNELWNGKHWTLAVVDQLKEDIRLSAGRLRWVIGNGMPLRPDFKVWVDDDGVEPKLARGARASWDICEPKVRERFAAEWESARKEGLVAGEYSFLPASERSNGKAAVCLPALSEVQVGVHLFEHSLRDSKSDRPRSYGFFVMVRGRLLNAEDALLSMSDPSYGTFYRCQYVIEADGLDEDLLADRERLHLETPRTREFAVLRDALYRASRQALEEYDAQAEKERRSESLLPVDSRAYFREPLTALLLSRDEDLVFPFDVTTAARIQRAPLAEADPIAKMDYEDGGFWVNLTHPLLKAVQDKLGNTKASREAMRALDLFAVSERLFEGFLYDMGMPDEQIARIVRWRDGLLRAMALRYDAAPTEEVVGEVRETSYAGSRRFEDALAKLFRLMGFEASRDGASGNKDVLVVAPIGADEYSFTVEAKGKNLPKRQAGTSTNGSEPGVENDAAEISTAAAHRDDARAKLAIVVARKFSGFERQGEKEPQILKECRATGGVSIVTVDVLAELLGAVRTYHYPLDAVLPILEEIEAPDKKLARVRSLSHPTEGFDYRGVLEKLWELQQHDAYGDIVPYRTLWHAGPDRWGLPDPEDGLKQFERRLQALESLSGHLLRVIDSEKAVVMRQNPEMVASCIQQAVESQQSSNRNSASNPSGEHRDGAETA